jgi:hypothetical protein
MTELSNLGSNTTKSPTDLVPVVHGQGASGFPGLLQTVTESFIQGFFGLSSIGTTAVTTSDLLVLDHGGSVVTATVAQVLAAGGGGGELILVQGTTTLTVTQIDLSTGITLAGSGSTGTLSASGGGGGGGSAAGPIVGYQTLSRPDMSTFGVLVENGGSNTGTIAQYTGGPILVSQVVSGGGTTLSTFLQAPPTDSTWTITTLMEIDPFLANGQIGYWGIVYKGPSYHCCVGLTCDSDHIYASKRLYDSLTDFTTTAQTTVAMSAVWLRVVNNGSQLLFQCSPNRVDWVQFNSENLGDFGTCLGIGLGIDCATSSFGGAPLNMSIWDWEYTSP